MRTLATFVMLCVGTLSPAADPPSFVGTWSTTYGRMVLTEQNGTLSGTYNKNGITGTQRDGKFTFTYYEPGVTGEGVFEIAPDGQSFSGKWRPAGGTSWSSWTGRRVPDAVKPAQPGLPGEIPDEPKPVVYRYDNLPQGLPKYFTEGDSDKDGQIGLYEWVKLWEISEAKLAEFKALDLNGDGLLTAEEYLRALKAGAVKPPPSGGQPVIAPPPGTLPPWGQSPGSTSTPLPMPDTKR